VIQKLKHHLLANTTCLYKICVPDYQNQNDIIGSVYYHQRYNLHDSTKRIHSFALMLRMENQSH